MYLRQSVISTAWYNNEMFSILRSAFVSGLRFDKEQLIYNGYIATTTSFDYLPKL
jgi:hypothetical protein